jgi:two-component system cell cycle sensor histidine kinase/response regulator CckA
MAMRSSADSGEQILREAGLTYQDIFEATGDAIFIHDQSGRIVFVNEPACAMLGYQREEILRLCLQDLSEGASPYAQADALERIEQALRDGQATFEWRSRRKDGTVFWCEVFLRASVVRDKAWIIASVRDISERKQIERELRESEGKFIKIFNGSSNAMAFSTLATARIVDVNQAWVVASGISREQALGKTTIELGLWPSQAEREACLAKFHEQRRLVDFEATFLLRGERRDYLLSADTIELDGKEFVLWEFRDVTARKLSERHLALMSFALDNVHEEAFLVDEQGRILYANQEASRQLGYTRDELLKLRVLDIHPDFPAERWPEHWREIKQSSAQVFLGRHRHKDGRVIPVEIVASYFEYEGRGYNLGLVRDISEREQAEEERTRMQSQLLQAQKLDSIGRLAGGVAHDFNNMLGVILGHADLILETTAPNSPIRAEIQQIRAAAQRSADLTRQLLAFARKQAVKPTHLDLNDTVEGMLKMLRRLIGENIEIVWRPGPGRHALHIDPAQIDQILANLVLNARDAIDDKGRVLIATDHVQVSEADCHGHPDRAPGPYVRLAVGDNGNGMDQATLQQIFEPFFTTKGPGHGTGLGLATVYGIVHQNAGFIDVDSEPGKGTTFLIHLPRDVDSHEQVRDDEPNAAPAGGTETILVVEDEPMLLQILQRSLARLGYRVLSTHDAGQALHIAGMELAHIHLLITDIVMPTMNGWDLAMRLRELRPDIKALFISGHPTDVMKNRSLVADGAHFLQKPFRLGELASSVRKALA